MLRGLGGMFLLALSLRAAWVLLRWSQVGPTLEFDDERLHWALARNLIEQGALVSDDGRFAARMPLYPLFLAPFAALGNVGVLGARLAQAALGAAVAVAGYRLARDAVGQRAAWIVGVVIAIDPFGIFFTQLLLTETLFTLLALLFVDAVWRFLEGTDRGVGVSLAWVALLGPLAILTRPSAAGWIVLVWGWLAWHLWHRPRAVVRAGAVLAVSAVLFLPWGLRNQAVLGAFCWLSANGGVTLYDAQGPQADGSSDQAFLQEERFARLSEVERDRELQRAALTQMRDDPQRVLELVGVKFLRTWNPVPNYGAYRRPVVMAASAGYTVPIVVVALTGLYVGRRRRNLLVALWLPIVYFSLLHCIYIGSVRYRVPLMPLLAVSSALVLLPARPMAMSFPERTPD